MRTLLASLFCLAVLTSTHAAEPSATSSDPVERAAYQYESGRFEEAIAILDELAKDGSTQSVHAYDLRGCIYLEQQKYDEAISAFAAAHNVDPNFFPTRIHHADALLRQGKWEEARNMYTALMRDTRILAMNERLRYGLLIANLVGKDEAAAKAALDWLAFPTETGAYYYGQAAWAFAHNDKRAAAKWLKTADEIFKPRQASWFLRPLHDRGWVKDKPPLVSELRQ
jgi:lipopolysaccharide biosynthesis regulator YciM